MDDDRRTRLPVALIVVILVLGLGLAYTAGYFGPGTVAVYPVVKYRTYQSPWLAYAFWPGTSVEAALIRRPVEPAYMTP